MSAVSTDLDTLLELLPERAAVCGPDGRLRHANALAQSLLGRTSCELAGRALADLVTLEQGLPEGVALLEHLLALPHGEGRAGTVVHRTGTQLRVELSASRTADGGSIVLLRPLAAHDVVSEARLRGETYALLFEAAPIGIFHFDAEGTITACNDAFVRIIGSSRRILVGLRIETLPDDAMRRSMREALKGNRAHFEGDYRSATAEKVTSVKVDFTPLFGPEGRVLGGVGIAENVTARKRAQEALQRSFESFRTLIEGAPDAILVHRGGRFLLVNTAAVRLLGYASHEEVLAVDVEDVLHPDELEMYRQRLPRMLNEGQRFPIRELRLRTKEGETVTTELAAIPIDYEGSPAVLAMLRDVTERKALEARLAQADRMATVGTLAAGVAHEINNPLAYVIGNLDLMEKLLAKLPAPRAEDVSVLRESLSHAQEGCERVRRIVRDLRIFSRAEDDRRVPVDVGAVIDSAINLAGSEIRDRADLVRETPTVSAVLGDEARLGQVVLNLLLNAAQAIPEGAPRSNTIGVATDERAGWVEIRIHDTGVGIPSEMLGRIFEPFFTTKPVGVGTGLGLAICHGIVRAHGGTIEVDSEAGHGSTFRVLLPAHRAPTAAAPVDEAEHPARASRILVIDDEVRFGETLRAALASRHDVLLATSGREGLAWVLRDGDLDFVVCDLMMPDVSGMAIFEEVRRARPELADRFVFMTGGAYTDEARAFLERVSVPRLEKPFGVAELERLLRRRQDARGG